MLIFSYSIDLDGAEFTSIHYVQKLLSNRTLYQNPEVYPFSVVIYTPLYLYILYGLCKLCSIDYINNIHGIYILSRLLSFTFVILTVVYMDKFIKKHIYNIFFRVFLICLFLILLTQHIYVVRTDSMKIAFFIMFLYYYIDYFYYSHEIKKIITAIFCAIISVAAKQDAIFYILLFQGVHFIFDRRPNSFLWIIVSLVSFALLFIVMSHIFGTYFNVSIFQFNAQVLSHYNKSYNIWVIIFNTIRLLPFYILFVFNLFRFRNNGEYKLLQVLSLSGIIAAITSSIFMLRPGSYLNYTYELISIAMFCLVIFMNKQKELPKKFYMYLSIYAMFVLLTGIITRTYSYTPVRETAFKEEYKHYYYIRSQLLPLLSHNECIFSLDLGLSLFLHDKNVIYGQEYHLDRMVFAHLGLRTTSRLLYNPSKNYDAYFTDGRVKYILVKENKENLLLLQEFYPRYKKEKQMDAYSLYAYQ